MPLPASRRSRSSWWARRRPPPASSSPRASKLALGDGGAQHGIWILPFVAWSLGILCQLLVLFPYLYRVGRNQPASWRDAFERARGIEYALLLAGGAFLIGGLLLATMPSHGR